MDTILTVRDLLLPGEPLDPAEVIAGQNRLLNPVTWVVSLRPFPPAFPRLRGGELALVATEHLSRLDPPTTLADVIRQLASRSAAGVAVRGEIEPTAMESAIDAAQEGGLPLLRLLPDAPLPDIEQAIMRECALYQARREILPAEEPGLWADDLLAGRFATAAEVQSAAGRGGYRLAAHYAVAYIAVSNAASDGGASDPGVQTAQAALTGFLTEKPGKAARVTPIIRPWEAGLAILLPQGYDTRELLAALTASGLSCGIGGEKPLLEAPSSLTEAQMAALSSALLHDGKPILYSGMGADRLLMLLYRHHPQDLQTFVDETLGPLLRHDAASATPILPTLRAFIAHGGRLRETASEIYVHRNTLAYRLDRAAEILGVDLKDADVRLAIELALRALPLVAALRER